MYAGLLFIIILRLAAFETCLFLLFITIQNKQYFLFLQDIFKKIITC